MYSQHEIRKNVTNARTIPITQGTANSHRIDYQKE